ncbi:MAG: Hint domain-containing protein [Maritimibacter sp.]
MTDKIFDFGSDCDDETSNPTTGDGIVSGTVGNDVIDAAYTGDPDGDMVDNNDAILPGEYGNDDIIVAGAGDDTVVAGEGNDEIYAGSGNDNVSGGAGNDYIRGDDNGDYATGDLITNGSFEDTSGMDETSYGYKGVGGFNGWTSTDPNLAVDVHDDDRDGVEPTDGDNWLDLDATPGNVSIYQDVEGAVEGAEYTLTFSAGESTVAPGNVFEVWWGGELIDTIDPAEGEMNEYSYTVIGGAGDGSDRLMFVQIGEEGWGYEGNVGASIDSVSLVGPIDDASLAGNDVLDGGAGDDRILGDGGDDVLIGGTGTNYLDGGSGDDTFIAGDGADTFRGGSGQDNIDYSGSDAAVNVNLETKEMSGGDADNDAIVSGVDGVIGSEYNDVLTGFDQQGTSPEDTFTNQFWGNGGDDIITAKGGDDFIDGGADNDTLSGGAGNDEILGGTGNDSIEGGDGDDVIIGGPGALDGALPDRGYPGLFPGDSDPYNDRDTILGGAGNDTIKGGDDNDYIDGGADNDNIDGGVDDDTILGGSGDDYIVGGEGSDSIDGGTGDDTIYGGLDPIYPDELNIRDDAGDLVTDNGMDVIHGGDGNDTIFGQDDDDTIFGDAGNDTIDGGIDEDVIDGGADSDTIDGGQGDDVIAGGSGDDVIEGGTGDDVIYGDSGLGTGTTSPVEITVTSEAAGMGNQVFAYTIDPVTGEISNLVILAEEADSATGITFEYDAPVGSVVGVGIMNEDGSFYSSGYGSNVSMNPDGLEHTIGEQHADGSVSLSFEDRGGLGDNDYNDVVLHVNLGSSGTTLDNAHFDYTSTVNVTGEDADGGADGNDIITAGDGDDLVFGEGGNDTIDGGAGNDDLHGGAGTDEVSGGEGNDMISGGEGDDTLIGGEGDDKLSGGVGDDMMEGGAGNDSLDGSEGADTMSGGDDRDTFVDLGVGDVIDGGAGGDDWDTLELTGSTEPGGKLHVTYTSADHEDGYVTYWDADGNETGTLQFEEIENVVPCFTPGTMIATPYGEKPVETLKVGDRVITRDNGIQAIKWIGAKEVGRKSLLAEPHLKPILIRAGALGNGLPERDMVVSPNHRVLVANDRTALFFDEREVLAAAKHLVDNKGVQIVEPLGVTYIHFMFEHHEVVLSDGAWTESFQPGDYSLKGIGNSQRQELFELFPELQGQDGLEDYTAARRILKKHEARMLVR